MGVIGQHAHLIHVGLHFPVNKFNNMHSLQCYGCKVWGEPICGLGNYCTAAIRKQQKALLRLIRLNSLFHQTFCVLYQ